MTQIVAKTGNEAMAEAMRQILLSPLPELWDKP